MYVYVGTVRSLIVPVPVQRGVKTWAGAGQGGARGGGNGGKEEKSLTQYLWNVGRSGSGGAGV